jgi:hypothetical protein
LPARGFGSGELHFEQNAAKYPDGALYDAISASPRVQRRFRIVVTSTDP